MYYNLSITFIFLFLAFGCQSAPTSEHVDSSTQASVIDTPLPGATDMETYLPLLQGKSVGMVVNQTSVIGSTHLVDSLLSRGIQIVRIFSPEHGFRGNADAGAHIDDAVDPETGLPIMSLYGSKRRPAREDMENIDVVIFDIQDVGVRFYTYISTLHYVMDACAEYGIPLLVLDRPNPNAHYVDGPMREDAYKSFVGMHPVPVVYGMTIGEYAQMINGENWLDIDRLCDLTVIKCRGYDHKRLYELPVAPSPNLPNLRSILLYPSLCFFEGTPISIGRGTTNQFQVIGHPDLPASDFTFTPTPSYGAAHPKLEGQICQGVDLTELDPARLQQDEGIRLQYIIDTYHSFPDKPAFFNENLWFDKLAGTSTFREAIVQGMTADEIRATWKEDLDSFKAIRDRYLLYRP